MAMLLLPSCGHAKRAATTATTRPQPAAAAAIGPAATIPAEPPGWTVIATTRGAIPGFAFPGGPRTGTVPATWHGAPSTLPVIDTRPGWDDVRLAQRPNESTAWVLASDVTLATTPYRIVVDLSTTHLLLYRANRLVFSAPAGIGTPAYPTPPGHFFVALLAAPPSPGYGAFVMVTSAHSNTITDWESSGDALVAIHGPLGSDAQIGTAGAAVSHGCVRLHEIDLEQLRIVPVGSPVDIVAS
jgi:lipoprotein-anchoring transpeptidase ErfK/SrfK